MVPCCGGWRDIDRGMRFDGVLALLARLFFLAASNVAESHQCFAPRAVAAAARARECLRPGRQIWVLGRWVDPQEGRKQRGHHRVVADEPSFDRPLDDPSVAKRRRPGP